MRKLGYDNVRIEPAPGATPTFPLFDGESEPGPEEYDGDDDNKEEEDKSEIRPLPKPPRCQSIELEPGHFKGCAYGYGDWRHY